MEKFVKQELNILHELLHHTHTEEITDPSPIIKPKKLNISDQEEDIII